MLMNNAAASHCTASSIVILALDFLMNIREMMVCREGGAALSRPGFPTLERIGLRSRPIRQDARRLKRCSSPTGEERP